MSQHAPPPRDRSGARAATGRFRSLAALLLACALTAPASPALSESASPGVATRIHTDLRLVARDAADLPTEPLRWRAPAWGTLALTACAVAAATLADEGVRATANDRRTPLTRHVANAVRGGGEPLGWGGGAVAALYLGGLASGQDTLRAAGLEMGEAALISGALVAGLKVVSGRARPDSEHGSGSFRPLRGGLDGTRGSFPSQHAAFAFALASAASGRLGGATPWLAYPLAGLVAASRVHDDRHWTSDVLAGAAIGTAAGRWVVGRHRERDGDGTTVTVGPWLADGGVGLAVGGRF